MRQRSPGRGSSDTPTPGRTNTEFRRRSRHDGVGNIVVLQMYENSFDMVNFQRATHALRYLPRPHHEMLDEKLAASVEKVSERHLPFWRVEDVILLDLHPGQGATLDGQFVAQSRELLFLAEQVLARNQPLFLRDDFVL